MKKAKSNHMSLGILSLAAAATVMQVSPVFGGTSAGEVTVSTSGSTALRNWFVRNTQTFTDIQPGNVINIGGMQYPTAVANASTGATGLGANEWSVNGGTAFSYQLAPSSFSSANVIPNVTEGSTLDQAQALRFEYHESGSVEGVLELANDQIAPVTFVTQNINRDPTTANTVYVNYNRFGGSADANGQPVAFNTSTGTGTLNSYTLGEFYANNQRFTLGGTAQPSFDLKGNNNNGGQNAVQLAISDAVPVQIFTNSNTTIGAKPWTATPQTPGFGQGNTALTGSGLGVSNVHAVYQSAASLNMPSGTINPRTGTAFGPGAWNSAGLGNLDSQTVAITATMFVANPGTGMTRVDRTDSQWLQLTGRLQNGAAFNMTTRDVNSGTRNVAALETGVDPTWAVGVNDDGNGNAADGGSSQLTVGAGLRFSNKTAGGNELRPTVQSSRMAVGTLSINDASGNADNGRANPVRALAYSDSTDGSVPYVVAGYSTISTGQYPIFQNEQFVTVKAPDSSYNNLGSSFGTNSPNVQGDNGTSDVKSLIQNTLNSVNAASAQNSSGGIVTASPAAGLLQQGYIIPQLMQVQKAQNGFNVAGGVAQITTNVNTGKSTQYDSSLATGTFFNNLVSAMTMGDPTTVLQGASSLYGANSLKNANPFGTNNAIAITSSNYLFGNFNQNGIRDFSSAVVAAQSAQASLNASGYGVSAFNGSGSVSVVSTSIAGLNSMPSQNGLASSANTTGTGATKGDLIVMGDYNGDGVFDGRDLYDIAVGASLSDPGNRPVLVGTGANTTLQAGTGTITVATGHNFGEYIATSVLNKNVALDYLNAVANPEQKLTARAVLTSTTGNTSTAIPAGSNFVGNEGILNANGSTGMSQFTYDPTGANAFNKSDVNSDGVVDFNDAINVDNFYGLSYTNQSNTLTTTEPTPVTGMPMLANLVLAQQIDTNTSIGASDLAVVNSQLSGGSLVTNWYAYPVSKTGPGTISWNGSVGTKVNLYTGASLQISSGTVQVHSSVDPFTDNNANAPASATDTLKSLAITITSGLNSSGGAVVGKLEYVASNSGFQVDRLSSLNVSGGGSALLDPVTSHSSNRTLLIAGTLSVGSSSTVDLGNNDLVIQSGSLSTITSLVKTGYKGGAWNGSGIASLSAAMDSNHLTALAVIQNNQSGSALFTSGHKFDGIVPNAGDILVKYTYYGDADLSGVVDGSDYTRIDNGYLNNLNSSSPALAGWINGDFNYDGVINGSDYTLIDNAFNTQGASLAADISPSAQIASEISGSVTGTSAVPEPATLGLLGVGMGSLLGRRRRRA